MFNWSENKIATLIQITMKQYGVDINHPLASVSDELMDKALIEAGFTKINVPATKKFPESMYRYLKVSGILKDEAC